MNNQKLNITQSVQEYVNNLYKRRYTPCIKVNGEWHYLLKGERIPVHKFNELFPLADKVGPYHPTREDIDKTHIH